MSSLRAFKWLVPALVAGSLAFAGCKKEDSGDTTAKKDESAEGTKDQAEAPAAGGSQQGAKPAKAAFAVFPKDSEVVFGLSVSQIRSSDLWKKYKDQLLSDDEDLKEVQENCGFDPVTKVDSVIAGGNTADDDAMVVVVKGISRDEAKSCGQAMADKKGEEFKVEDEGNLSHYTYKGESIWVAWLDDTTLLTGPKGKDDKAWVQERAAGKDGLDTNAEFMKLLDENVDSSASVWFGMIPGATSPMGASMGMGGAKPKAIFGSVLATAGIKLDAGVRFASADDAKKMADQATQMMGMVKQNPQFGKYADKIAFKTNDKDLIVQANFSDKDLGEIATLLKGSLGAMMPGLGGGGL
jgi:hypothetical protein